ncbi:ParB N-terminal domain-containing protein [Mycobacteroides abscessus]|uniref:ParB N-terminal domain-containing protein n=1 Tax=Mycobacteroides abscessus TaxID=36809 RepID=UPI00266BDD15|nr:ParB N-terminal domain-containing protein [Mycobacteroides abscessus]MDO3331570.1 hypothetical protein [Mycobacteroides abscessus subsp. abscessus]
MSAAEFQVMPRLTADEYAELEASIVEHGVQVPIVLSRDDRIVDGYHRDEIARKHSLHCPRVYAEGDESSRSELVNDAFFACGCPWVGGQRSADAPSNFSCTRGFANFVITASGSMQHPSCWESSRRQRHER